MRLLRGEPRTFEEWVAGKFGKRLYDIFFRTYTEKVWGVPGVADRRRVGGAADPELLARDGDPRRARAAARARDDADRGVPLPAARPRADVAASSRAGSTSAGIPVQLNRRCIAIRHDGGRVDERS